MCENKINSEDPDSWKCLTVLFAFGSLVGLLVYFPITIICLFCCFISMCAANYLTKKKELNNKKEEKKHV